MDVIRYNICEHFRCTHCCNICEREGLTKENKMVPQPVIRSFPYDIPDDGKFIPLVGDVIEVTFIRTGSVVRGTVTQVDTGMKSLRAFSRDSFVLYSSMPPIPMSFRLLKRVRKYEVGTIISGHEAANLPVGTILGRKCTGVYNASYDVVILSTKRANGTPLRSNRYRRIDLLLSWNSISGEWRIKYIPEVN